MNKIKQTLDQIGCGITDLPKPFQTRIESINKISSEIDEVEKSYNENPTDDEKEKLEDIQNFHEDYVDETCEMIEKWYDDLKEQAKQDANSKNNLQNSKAMPLSNPSLETKKKGLGLGGIIIGVAVLAITMGAVNTMRSK